MGITNDGFFDWMERVPGPAWKQVGGINPVEGFVGHSAVGFEGYLRGYNLDHSDPRRASWTVSNLYAKTPMQHYPIYSQCWASSALYPNTSTVPVEHEGGYYNPFNPNDPRNNQHEPLTEHQIDVDVRMLSELSALRGWTPTRQGVGKNLWEHGEWGSTQCPSGRIPWDEILRRLEVKPPTPVAVRRAVDFSLYQGYLSTPIVSCWQGQGVDRVLLQYNTSGAYEHNVGILAPTGIRIDAYVGRLRDDPPGLRRPEWRRPGDAPYWAEDAIRRAGGRARQVFTAWESDAEHGPFSAQDQRDCVSACQNAGIPSGVYTRAGYWTTSAGNTQEFAWLDLWDARYLPAGSSWPASTVGAGTSRPYIPYGGFARPAIWQFHGTTQLCGFGCDLNVYEPAAVVTPAPKQLWPALAAVN